MAWGRCRILVPARGKEGMMLPTVTLLGRVLPTYGLFAALGAVLGLGISLLRCHMFGRSRDDCA